MINRAIIMVTDINLDPPAGMAPYCIGRDRGGKFYQPIFFREAYVPAQGSIWWVRSESFAWVIERPVVNKSSIQGLGVGDRRISAARNLYLQASNVVIDSTGERDNSAPQGAIKIEGNRLYVMTSDGWKYVELN